jgi:hypothetical protein
LPQVDLLFYLDIVTLCCNLYCPSLMNCSTLAFFLKTFYRTKRVPKAHSWHTSDTSQFINLYLSCMTDNQINLLLPNSYLNNELLTTAQRIAPSSLFFNQSQQGGSETSLAMPASKR